MPHYPAAVIFDMDQTLAATVPPWLAAETKLLRTIGHDFSDELALQYRGMNALDTAATIHRLLKPEMPVETCKQIMRDALVEAFAAMPVAPMPGAVECVRRLRRICPLAVASGSPPPAIGLALKQLGITDQFQVVISSEAVTRGKPHPDVFLAAAKALGAAPSRCLVFEDSLVGVQAARAAGMACFAVPSARAEEIRRLATRTFASLADVAEADLAGLG